VKEPKSWHEKQREKHNAKVGEAAAKLKDLQKKICSLKKHDTPPAGKV
jgi:cell fate (sporulation/competence/biofilm development) regulator YmcA (YheA/YmcA/DUF963 family)